jgi:hypothetical protein
MRTMLRMLGIVIPVAATLGYILVTGRVLFGPTPDPRGTLPSGSQAWLIVSALLLEAVAGVVSGLLLRSLWALLVVPSGLVLGAIAGVFLSGNWYAMNEFFFVILIMFMVVTFGVASLPSVAAAAVGVQLSRRFSKPAPQLQTS